MGTVKPGELLRLWSQGKATAEMVIGHLIQNLIEQQTTIQNINLTLYNLRADVDSRIAHTGMKLNPKGRKKPPQKG